MVETPIAAIGCLTELLTQQNIPYFLGGSFASSAHGEFRATQDIDIVCDLEPALIDDTIALLKKHFVVDEQGFRAAWREKRSFNIFHTATFFKFDFFFNIGAFEKSQLTRAQIIALPDNGCMVKVSTPEDTILAKLRWYELGNRVSDRQWRDIQGVIKVNQKNLDLIYLRDWAEKLNLKELLEKSLES